MATDTARRQRRMTVGAPEVVSFGYGFGRGMGSSEGMSVSRRTGSSSPPAWTPQLKSRPQARRAPWSSPSDLDLGMSAASLSSLSAAGQRTHTKPTHPRASTTHAVPVPAYTPAFLASSPILSGSHSHMPASIFPGPVPGGGAPLLPSANLAAHTRQTTQRRAGPSPLGTGVRRPLRSSPLAGPSLALGTDGTLTGSEDEDDVPRVRYRPNRISSTPEIDAGTYEKLRTSSSAPTTPTGSPGIGHRQFVLEVAVPAERERVVDLNAEERTQIITTSPTSTSPTSLSPTNTSPTAAMSPVVAPATAKQHRRLSLGFKRLSALPGLPSLGLHRRTTSRDESPAPMAESAPRRSRTVSGPAPPPSSPTKAQQVVPPVPSIPEWARIAVLSPEPGQSIDKRARRPSTAPTSPTFLSPAAAASSSSLGSTKSTRHRHSHDQQCREQQQQQPHQLQAQHQPQPQSHPHPSPEHRPFAPVHPPPTQHAEASWMTSSASPRFSRLGLKGAGVVLPVSANAKEAKAIRRRSNASGLGLSALMDGADGGSVRSARSVRSTRSIISTASRRERDGELEKGGHGRRSGKGKEREGSGAEGEGDVEPPSAPFMHVGARRGSSSASECSGSSIASVGSIGTIGSTTSSVSVSAEEATPASSVCSVGSVALSTSRSTETVTETETEGDTDEFGVDVLPTVLEERLGERDRGKKGGIELRVNDVTVDVLDFVHEGARPVVGRKGTLKGKVCEKVKERVKEKEKEAPAEARREKGAEVKRGGTLKRMWKRVVGHGDR